MIVDPADSSYMPSLVVVSGMCMFSEKSEKYFCTFNSRCLVSVNIVIYLTCIVPVYETNTIIKWFSFHVLFSRGEFLK